jgi:hypothetical protein
VANEAEAEELEALLCLDNPRLLIVHGEADASHDFVDLRHRSVHAAFPEYDEVVRVPDEVGISAARGGHAALLPSFFVELVEEYV